MVGDHHGNALAFAFDVVHPAAQAADRGVGGQQRLGRDRAGAGAVFIANVLKCRPPANRNPEPSEVAACAPFLRRQVQLLRPRIIVVMGRFAAQCLLDTDATIGSLRGRVHDFALDGERIPVVVTYHPAYLLRTLSEKARSWEDLCLARAAFDERAAAPQAPPPT